MYGIDQRDAFVCTVLTQDLLLCFVFLFLCCGGRLANAQVEYGQFFCPNEDIPEGIAPGDTWTSTSRGLCSVMAIYVHLTLPDGKKLACYDYPSYGTSSPLYIIFMDGVDSCEVKSYIRN